MQLTRQDTEILTEAASRLLEAESNARRVICETFLKAHKQGTQEAGSDNEHQLQRGNSNQTLTHLELMVHLIDAFNSSKLHNMAYDVAGMEFGRASEYQLEWYATQRAGAEDSASATVLNICDRNILVHGKEE